MTSNSLTPQQGFLLLWPWISSSSAALIGYNLRNIQFPVRYIAATVIGKSMQWIQNNSNEEWKQLLPERLTDSKNNLYWLLINTYFTLTMVNGMTAIYGGQKYFEKHGIDNYKKALIASTCNGSVYFKENKNARSKALKKLIKLTGIVGIAVIISKLLKSNTLQIKTKIEGNALLNMEILGLLLSMETTLNAVPSLIHYFIFGGNDDIEVISPYGEFPFFSCSIRDFWKNWSRPAGELLRYAVYQPLGGRDRYWLSVPVLFALNCTSHYDFSINMYGYRAMKEWNIAFGIMAIGLSLHMFVENVFLKQKYKEKIDDKQENNVKNSLYYKLWSYGLFNVTMAATLYVVHKKAMICNLDNVANTFYPFTSS